MGLAFVIATLVMVAEAEKDVQFHTSEQLSHTAARSSLYTFLNSERNINGEGPLSSYNAISLCKSEKPRRMDRRAITNRNAVPDIVAWMRVNGTKYGADCNNGGDRVKIGEVGSRSSNSLNPDGPNQFNVKIPYAGGNLFTVTMEYEADAGALS